MRKRLFVVLSFTALCCYSYAQDPGIIVRDLKKPGNTVVSPAEYRQFNKSSDSHSLVLTPPDTTKMASNRKFVWAPENERGGKIAVDSVRTKVNNVRWRVESK